MAKIVLRTISAFMFVIAVVYLGYVFTHPEFGSVFNIGKFQIGSAVWRIFYCLYAVTMVGLFVGSSFVKAKTLKKGKSENKTRK